MKDLVDGQVVDTHNAVVRLAAEKAAADTAAAEALAAAVQVYGSATEVSELTGIPAADVEKATRGVTVARAKEVLDAIRAEAIARSDTAARRRRDKTRPNGSTDGAAPAPSPTPTAAEPEQADAAAAG